MRHLRLLSLGLGLIVCLHASAQVSGRPGGLAALPDFKDFRAGRSSSFDPTGGNADGRHDWPMKPGDTRTIAEISGAGAITHIWTTIATQDKNHLKNMVIRMYWDGEETPSVEAPIGDFFGLGHGQYYQYWSQPIQIGVDKGLNCYWRMPFSAGARITVSNDGDLPGGAFYYYVDYEIHDKPQPKTGRFHAQYRQAYPCVKGVEYALLEATGTGHYVGCNLSIHNRAGGWWGEGDDLFFVDGEETPSLRGTGSEDYFCGAWCYGESFRQPFSGPYFGCPLNDGGHTQNARWNVYRYHIEDPVPFKKSLKLLIEHGHANLRQDDFSSVAYWYQGEPHAEFPPFPKAADRLPVEATVYVEPYTFEAEDMAAGFQNALVTSSSTTEFGNFWSSGLQLLINAEGPGCFKSRMLTYPSDAGKYNVDWWYTAGPDYGLCELYLNDQKICEWDGYAKEGVVHRKLDKPTPVTVSSGENFMEIRIVGKNEGSSGFKAGLDCFRVVPR